MNSEADQALLQPHEHEENKELEPEIEIKLGLQSLNVNHLKSFEILKSAVESFTSNTKYMLFMILSIIPFFAFMVFYEIKIPVLMDFITELLYPPYISYESYIYDSYYTNLLDQVDLNDRLRKGFRILLEFFPFYFVFLPLLELFSLTIIIKLIAKVYAGTIESTSLKETFYQKNNLKGPLITSLWVQLLSTSTLFGLVWAVANHIIITNGFNNRHTYYYDFFLQKNLYVSILSTGFHALIFLALLKKYLDWCALWNMAIVISVLEADTGIDALELSAYYGKHCKRTGFKLMLMVFSFSIVLRLPFLLARMCNNVIVTVVVTAICVGLACLGSLLKWVALVLYFYDCKAQVLLKKDDEEVRKAVKIDDLC